MAGLLDELMLSVDLAVANGEFLSFIIVTVVVFIHFLMCFHQLWNLMSAVYSPPLQKKNHQKNMSFS